MKGKSVKTKLKKQSTSNFAYLFAVIVALIGMYALHNVHASSPYISSEAENGTLQGTANILNDGNASGGKYVQFGCNIVVYPLKLSSNKRYLVDQNNCPFFYTADTQWVIFSALTTAQAEQYISERKAQGFNTIQAYIVNFNGAYTSPEGLQAFTNESTMMPNPAYFSKVDTIINYANSIGMNMVLGPWELDSSFGQTTLSTTNYENFATYLGSRYKNFNNIIWMLGGDHDPINNYGTDAGVDYTPEISAEASGFTLTDTRHLITYHPHRQTSQWTQLENSTWLSFNMIQYNRSPSGTTQATPYAYDWVKTDYDIASPIKGTVLAEPAYEPSDAIQQPTSPYDVRRSAYWAVFSGSLGVAYGSGGCCTQTNPAFDAYLNNGGAVDTGYLHAKLTTTLPWWILIPDESHTSVTAGYGTYGLNNFVTAERASDGSMVVAYLPVTSTITVNMAMLNGPVKARWFDPSNGNFTTIGGSPFTNTGTHQFTPPTSNSVGNPDFVLVLTTF